MGVCMVGRWVSACEDMLGRAGEVAKTLLGPPGGLPAAWLGGGPLGPPRFLAFQGSPSSPSHDLLAQRAQDQSPDQASNSATPSPADYPRSGGCRALC